MAIPLQHQAQVHDRRFQKIRLTFGQVAPGLFLQYLKQIQKHLRFLRLVEFFVRDRIGNGADVDHSLGSQQYGYGVDVAFHDFMLMMKNVHPACRVALMWFSSYDRDKNIPQPGDEKKKMKEFSRLIRLMKRLRSPVNGCPWDRSQTPETLSRHIIEEANELAAAIQSGSVAGQIDELGDLLLQVVFLSRIHQERGNFSIRDVMQRLREKLIRRHPHIFGSQQAKTAEDVKMLWEQVKQKEKGRDSVISNYPQTMPALAVAARIGEQAASVGFDWRRLPSAAGQPFPDRPPAELALEKVPEEAAELKTALEANDPQQIREELGDLLFALVNVARLMNINPETALWESNNKFTRRFRCMESRLRAAEKTFEQVNADELEKLWRECKGEELKS